MTDSGRRIVVDLGYEAAVGEVNRALQAAGLQVIARTDVRDQLWTALRHGFRYYMLLEAWSPDLAFEALRHNLDAGVVLPTTFAIYELGDGETAIVAREPFSAEIEDLDWRRDNPLLADIADTESERVAKVLGQLQHLTRQAAILPAS